MFIFILKSLLNKQQLSLHVLALLHRHFKLMLTVHCHNFKVMFDTEPYQLRFAQRYFVL